MANDLKSFASNVSGKDNIFCDYKDTISPTGDFNRVETINVLINSLRNLLLTPLGSYPFNPEYGSELYKKVFEPLDSQSIEDIKFEVKDRVVQFDDRINVESVFVSPLSDNKGVNVSVKIKKGQEEANVKVVIDKDQTFGLE